MDPVDVPGLLREGLLDPSRPLVTERLDLSGTEVERFIGEFWTSRQRQGHSLHEISYRACFKGELPAFFIDRFTEKGDIVYDPFAGRGTSVIEAALRERGVIGNDVNPLSRELILPRLDPPLISEVEERLRMIPTQEELETDIDLSMFFHPDTFSRLLSIRSYLRKRREDGNEDRIDRWIRMVATNRLTGHSSGFFSVYTLPPNQTASQASQLRINRKRGQIPSPRDVDRIILKKTRSLMRRLTPEQRESLAGAARSALLLTEDARSTPEIPDSSVQLTVTSPPFLDVVQYSTDNWMRCWFNHIDEHEVSGRITFSTSLKRWSSVMEEVFMELYRITAPGGWVAFEVGEVRKGTIELDRHVVPMGPMAGFSCKGVVVNAQNFTKTANIWGVNNMEKGTNSNRIILFRKNGS